MSYPIPEKRIAEFEKLGFGMFVHYGLYSQLGKGEWIMNKGPIAKDEYTKLFGTFTASEFDAKKIVSLAKRAGQKYIVLTARHHDGFSLYDTKGLCDYDAPHSPCKRDLAGEFVDACNCEGIKPFFYHTTLDWYQPAFENDFNSYLEYLRKSVEVLCTNYGKIGGLWFDGNWSKKDCDWKESELYATIRKHQPDAIIINNTGLSNKGKIGDPQLDSVTFEQGRPTPMDRSNMTKYVAAEMCETLNDHWGYGTYDLNYKSVPHIIKNLCHCRKVGANYLLNIGPAGNGSIPKMQQCILELVGDWMQVNGQYIYDGKPCGVLGDGDNFGLDTGDSLALFAFNIAISGIGHVTAFNGTDGWHEFTGVTKKINAVKWADNNQPLEFKQQLDKEKLYVKFTGYDYGTNLVARIAKAEYK